ncbi:MAG: hypothetical protein PHO57_12195 [Acidithiobacillus sp.]|nr:hypothetical protein [Acidithiobacillus sp.]
MIATRKLTRFIAFVFGPLFIKGRWCIWALLFLMAMMMGNTITAIRMDIPNIEQVNRVTGKFVDISKGYGKGVLFDIAIVDAYGITHRCNCEPLAYSNCLGRRPSDHAEILNQLDPEMVKKYTLQKAIVNWLDGRNGEVWMYPNRSLFGTPHSCYKISSNGYTLLSFEQSVQNYQKAKSGLDIYLFWFISLSGLFAISVFVIVRINTYLKEVKNG